MSVPYGLVEVRIAQVTKGDKTDFVPEGTGCEMVKKALGFAIKIYDGFTDQANKVTIVQFRGMRKQELHRTSGKSTKPHRTLEQLEEAGESPETDMSVTFLRYCQKQAKAGNKLVVTGIEALKQFAIQATATAPVQSPVVKKEKTTAPKAARTKLSLVPPVPQVEVSADLPDMDLEGSLA